MANELNYRVVAEGIESYEQYDFLKANYCHRGQGFLLCIPLPEEKLSNVLKMYKYNRVVAV